MPWFRTTAGQLAYAPEGGVGGLADVYRQAGHEEVDDEVAEAEVSSGEAQARADADAEQAARVDAAVTASQDLSGRKGKTTQVPVDVPGVGEVPLEITVGGTPPVTPEVEAEAQKALDEETPAHLKRPDRS